MTNKLLKYFLMGMVCTSSVAFAEGALDKVINSTSKNGGSDTCGLGWEVTQSKTLLGTSTRGTTNAYLSPTWSMTSGTSGCEKHPIAKRDEEAVRFAATNYHLLRADMAQGQGEYIAGLGRVLGCDDQGVQALGAAAQEHFSEITQGADAYQMVQNVRAQAAQSPALAGNCNAIL